MNAEDTVMTHKQRAECSHNPNLELRERDMCQAQAEISFPLGEQKGRREVVEVIDNTGLIEHTDSPLHEIGATILDCPACCWYAYKQKWGL